MNEVKIIDQTIKFVKKELQNAEGGHDWFHIERVYRNALLISKTENVDRFVVSLGALLHDIADAKFHKGDETIGPKRARGFLTGIQKKLLNERFVQNAPEKVIVLERKKESDTLAKINTILTSLDRLK